MKDKHKHMKQLIDMIDNAKGIYQLPWRRCDFRPTNFSTKRQYRGINPLNLMTAQLVNNYSSGQWLTFRQALKMDACVRKGEKGAAIVFYKQIKAKDDITGEPCIKQVLRFSTVFNIDQIEGIELPVQEDLPNTHANLVKAREFCDNVPIKVNHGGGRAFYRVSTDEIHMPHESEFFDTDDANASQHYISTLLHEQAHGTGHKSRLDRPSLKHYNIKSHRGFEELVAEITAAMLSVDLGVSQTIRSDHAEYLASWKSVIKNDPNVLLKAASAAEKAIDVLFAYQNSSEKAA